MTDGAPPVAISGSRPTLQAGFGVLLLGGFAAGAAATIALTLVSPTYGFMVPAAALGLALLVVLSRVPLGSLIGVMVLFGVTARLKAGLQVEELVFAAYYLGFLVHWFTTRLFVYREPVLRTPTDVVVIGFLLWMTSSLGLTLIFGGDLTLARNDWINFSMLAFYFPVKEATERYRWGPWVIVGLIVYLGTFCVIRNVTMLTATFGQAAYAWEVARGRVPMNEMLMFIPAIGCLTFAIRARALHTQFWLTAGFAMFTVGVILTQWRAYYVDLAFGVALLFIFARWRQKRRLLVLTTLSAAVGLGLAYLVFGELVELLVLGVVDRALSIGTAAQSDISLRNRMLETARVWDLIVQNPVVGYGMGTQFGFYDTIFNGTWVKPYVHNGFLMLWYKFGIVGLAAVVVLWVRSIASAFSVWRSSHLPLHEQTLGLALLVVLISLIPSHFVAATFATSDTVMMFAITTGLTAGEAYRTRRAHSDPTMTGAETRAGTRTEGGPLD